MTKIAHTVAWFDKYKSKLPTLEHDPLRIVFGLFLLLLF